MQKKVLNIAHRGASGYKPENTLSSFRHALTYKPDMIELDVYVCLSGELVVIHDDKVDRTTNGQGYVVEKRLSELKKLDAGQGEKIPTLIEILNLVNGKIAINIELKGAGTAKPVAKLIKEYLSKINWQAEQFLVSSFNHPELATFKKLLPNIRIGALFVGIPAELAKPAEDLGAYSINLSQEFISQEFVNDAHRRGLKVFVFTVNDFDDIDRMIKLGVDGLFCNYPDRLQTQ
ncbi:MAG: glycerophosphodiester phosphodiesterase family protein [Patescibacteria group bacterium]|nr:glycerophosphodiester phosphodiesterase family protein [Patescibacteria group bacterium]MDD5715172.1 glycerophosphodiester phosphodiesterase family protein [Patescibacteria group bacterium]